MRSAYKYLAFAIPVLVAVQAAAIAFALFGLGDWVDSGGGHLNKANENTASFTGSAGFAIHSITGTMLIPLVALALLVVSFFAKVPGGVRWAALIVGDVVLQIALALVAFSAAAVGLLHGLNAFVLFGLAMMAGTRASRAAAPAAAAADAATG